jgi:hypothetical protein
MRITLPLRSRVTHMIIGLIVEDRAGRPIGQCLVRSLVVVEREPSSDAQTRLAHRGIRLDEGEWRGGLQPRAPRTGREPLNSSGSHHPAADLMAQWANRVGLRRRSERNDSQAAIVCPRNRLYLRDTHRTIKASTVRSSSRSWTSSHPHYIGRPRPNWLKQTLLNMSDHASFERAPHVCRSDV